MSVKIMREDGTLETVSGMAEAGVSMSEWTEGGVYKGVSFASATSTFNLMPVSYEQDSSGATEIWDRNVPGGQRKATIPGFGVELSNHTLAFAYPSGGGSTIQSAVMCLSGHTHEPAQAGVTLTGTGDQILKVGGDTATIIDAATVNNRLATYEANPLQVAQNGCGGVFTIYQNFCLKMGSIRHYHLSFYAGDFTSFYETTGYATAQIMLISGYTGSLLGGSGPHAWVPCSCFSHNRANVNCNFYPGNTEAGATSGIVYGHTLINNPYFTLTLDLYTIS